MADVCRELAGLGFDEILLDNWAFPAGGEGILADNNYPAADGRTAVLEGFLDQVEEALTDYPEVRVSLVTTSAAAAGGGPRDRADRRLAGAGRPGAGQPGGGGDPAPAGRPPP